MKRLLLLLPAAALIANCSTPKTAQTGSTGNMRSTNGSANVAEVSNAADTATIGTQFIPILGRNESGILTDLEGTWVLTTMNGSKIKEVSGVDTGFMQRKAAPGTEISRDSVTTSETVKGVTETTTTTQVDRMGNPVRRITPPQGSNYHIPQQPDINFYGSNETFSGFTGCNRFSGRYVVTAPNSINLKSAAASTKMVCIGDYDEDAFLSTMHKVGSFKAVNGQLQLMQGENVLMVFTKR